MHYKSKKHSASSTISSVPCFHVAPHMRDMCQSLRANTTLAESMLRRTSLFSSYSSTPPNILDAPNSRDYSNLAQLCDVISHSTIPQPYWN
jgi:hypothetical protein